MTNIVKLANDNEGFIALLTFVLLSIVTPLAIYGYRSLFQRITSGRSESDILRIERIRTEFYTHLTVIDESSSFGPFLIRDVARDRLYFDGDEQEFSKKGAPPSFKVQVVDFSVHGISAYQGYSERIKLFGDGDRWCLADESDTTGILAHPIGVIPFSSIVAINWHGDPAHLFPHIYCHFDQLDGWPFKNFQYCEKRSSIRGWPSYKPLVDADKLVRRHF